MGDEAKDFNQEADAFLDEVEKETPSGTSTVNKPEGEETKATETETADVSKTEKVKEVEADTSLSVEEKLAKVKEILGDDEKAIDAYIKQKGYHKDPAWQKQREIIDRLKKEGAISEEDKKSLREFKEVTSSREYVELSMRKQGYTQEAIDNELKKKGFQITEKPTDDVDLVINKLKIDPKAITGEQRADIADISRIVRVIMEDGLNKALPNQLKPIQDFIGETSQAQSANKITSVMKEITKNEGILDFDKDVEPEIHRFLDENPESTQEDVLAYFKDLNHRLTVERLKTGKKKEERDLKKTNQRQIIPTGGTDTTIPKKTGEFDKDADAFLDHLGVS